METLNSYHTISESAEILGVSRVTLHRWIKKGKLKPEESAWGRSFFTLEQLKPYVVKQCSTCYHQGNRYCSCRDLSDIGKHKDKCPDWRWKWS